MHHPFSVKGNLCIIIRIYVAIIREAFLSFKKKKKISTLLWYRYVIIFRILSVFIFECFHDQQDSSHREKPSRKYLTRYSQNGQIVFLSFFLSFFLSSDNLAQRCLNLSRWFSHETAAFSTEQCNVPSLFRYLQFFTKRLQLPTQ